MSTIFDNIIHKGIDENIDIFYNQCGIIILEFPNINILLNQKINNKLNLIITKKNIYHFKSNISKEDTNSYIPNMNLSLFINNFFPKKFQYFEHTTDKFYYYIILESDNKEKLSQLINKLNAILQNIVPYRLIHSNNSIHKEELSFHLICENIAACYTANSKKYNDYPEAVVSDIKLLTIEHKMTIQEFITKLDYNENIIKSSMGHSYNFHLQLGDNYDYKSLREEYYIIKNYILKINISKNSVIELGQKTEQWDAKINDNIIIEITHALPKNEYLTRKVLAEHMYGHKSFPLNIRTKHQHDLNEFPDKIIDAIDKKHKKQYNDNRILIVVVLYEYIYFNNVILEGYINILKNKISLHEFKEIWLCIDDSNFFKLA